MLEASSVSVVELPGLSQRLAHRGVQRLGADARSRCGPCESDRRVDRRMPKVARITLVSAFAPSTMNNRQTLGSRPRSTRLSMSACTTAAFLVAPSARPSGCLLPSRRYPARRPGPGRYRCAAHRSGSPQDRAATDPSHPRGHALGRERHEPARRRRFRGAVSHDRQQIAPEPYRALELARRDVDQRQIHRPAAKSILGLGRSPGRQLNLMAVAAHARPTHVNLAASTLPPWKLIFPSSRPSAGQRARARGYDQPSRCASPRNICSIASSGPSTRHASSSRRAPRWCCRRTPTSSAYCTTAASMSVPSRRQAWPTA